MFIMQFKHPNSDSQRLAVDMQKAVVRDETGPEIYLPLASSPASLHTQSAFRVKCDTAKR